MAAEEVELLNAAIESLPDEQREAAQQAIKKVKNHVPPWAWGLMLVFSSGIIATIKTVACPALCGCTPPAATAVAGEEFLSPVTPSGAK